MVKHLDKAIYWGGVIVVSIVLCGLYEGMRGNQIFGIVCVLAAAAMVVIGSLLFVE